MAGCNLIDETEDAKLNMMRKGQVTIRIKQDVQETHTKMQNKTHKLMWEDNSTHGRRA